MGRLTAIQTEVGELKLSPKAMKAVEALIACGGNVAVAAKYADMSPRQVSRVKAKPGVKSLMRMRAREILAEHEPMAAVRMVELMKQDKSLKTSFEASRRILDVAGIKPPDGPGVQVNLAVMTPAAQAFRDRTNMTLRTKEDREEYDRLAAEGAFANSGWAGYVLDFSPEDGEPAIEHQGSRGTER